MELAEAYHNANALNEAREAALRAVTLAPKLAVARILLGKIELKLQLPSTVATLKTALRDTLSDTLRVEAHTYIAEYLRNQGQHLEAYDSYVEANRIRSEMASVRTLHEFDHTPHPESLLGAEAWANTIETADLAKWPTSSPPLSGPSDPVFMVGFPRSGTSLLSRILSKHRDLCLLNEETTVETMVHALLSVPRSFPDLRQRQPHELDRAKEIYWSNARYRLNRPLNTSLQVVDKLPLNILRLPVLARIFPKSRFLVVLRDPRDACLSCFMQNFRPTVTTANFLDIESTARCYAACFRILSATAAQLPLNLTFVKYEDLIRTPESTLKTLFSNLQVPWNDRLTPASNQAQSQSSFTQSHYSEPLYTSAVERWRNYEEATQIMTPWLKPFLDAYGYPSAQTSQSLPTAVAV